MRCKRRWVHARARGGARRSFEAPVAACEGDLWQREAVRGESVGHLYATQKRWTQTGGALLGLVAQEATAAGVRAALDLDGLDHQQARRSYLGATTMRERGAATMSLLEHVRVDETLWGRLLHAGQLGGVWAAPFVWDARLSRRVFPGFGTTRSSAARTPL